MQINITSRKFSLTDALQQYVKRRINFALATKSEHIKKVVIRLSDINGPRGGADKRCHLQVVLKGMPDVVVEDTQTDMYNAIDRASDRVSRTVVRKIGRQQKLLRQVIPFAFEEESIDEEITEQKLVA
jgi:putative sigma-54 modulation protein